MPSSSTGYHFEYVTCWPGPCSLILSNFRRDHSLRNFTIIGTISHPTSFFTTARSALQSTLRAIISTVNIFIKTAVSISLAHRKRDRMRPSPDATRDLSATSRQTIEYLRQRPIYKNGTTYEDVGVAGTKLRGSLRSLSPAKSSSSRSSIHVTSRFNIFRQGEQNSTTVTR